MASTVAASATDALNATRCPLCGNANQCAMEIECITGLEQPPCWCTTVRFEADLLAKIPAAQRNLACICAACARQTS
ncbi:MAG: cysteine-rich CWC family protein [Burkholderiaceae bacterium]|nr:cysteine-rich CWC family protein [Burkholderiaceae bacterium]